MTIEEYHSNENIGSSKLRDFMKSPLVYRDKYVTKTHPDLNKEKSRSLILGQAFECLIDPNVIFSDLYYTIPENAPKKPTKTQINAKKPSEETVKAIEWWESFNNTVAGKIELTHDEILKLDKMDENFNANKTAVKLWDKCKMQATYTSEFKGVGVQCRFDGLIESEKHGIDLKTTSTPLEDFAKSVTLFRYDIQQAFYEGVFEMCEHEPMDKFSFIVCETIYPWRCQVITLPDDVVFKAHETMIASLKKLCTSIDSGIWEQHKSSTMLEFKQWQLKELGIN